MSDRDQTVELNSLLDDISDSSAQNDLSTVGLTGEFETLRRTQQEFVDLIDQRAAEEGSRQLPQLRIVRGLLREDLTVAVASLTFAERLDPGTFTSLVEAVSEHIIEVVANTRARRTRSESDEVSTTEDLAPIAG